MVVSSGFRRAKNILQSRSHPAGRRRRLPGPASGSNTYNDPEVDRIRGFIGKICLDTIWIIHKEQIQIEYGVYEEYRFFQRS